MTSKVCSTPGCPEIVDRTAYRSRCPACNRAADRQRGSREDRGYGRQHRTTRATYAKAIERGEIVLCWRCHEPITDVSDLHLGHDDEDRSVTRGPEHSRRCNLRAAGLKGGG